MSFYIKDYALYTETKKNPTLIRSIEQDPFVHITLGGDKESGSYLEIASEAEVVADIVMLKVLVQKVKLVGE